MSEENFDKQKVAKPRNPKAPSKVEAPKSVEQEGFRHMVRVVNTDLDGNKQLVMALQKIKGIGFMLSHAICTVTKIDPTFKTGYLDENQVELLTGAIRNPASKGIPQWMFNRRKDMETGDDIHMFGSDLTYAVSNDIKAMMRLRNYRGTRHFFHLPSRGQSTKSNFRKSKVKNAAKKKRGSSPEK
jgi:small subunit ribosomal protein S13